MSYRGEPYLWNENKVRKNRILDFNAEISNASTDELESLFDKIMEEGTHGFCFSMYAEGQRPGDVITEDQVRRRMKILHPHTQWIRSFSCIEGNELIPKVAKEMGMKTLVGAWLGDDKEKNEIEINALIELAEKGLVDIASVGNEVLYRDDLSLDRLLGYIESVKEAIPGIPVGYVDAYYEFSNHPTLSEICDVILCNCYPYWEGCPLEYSLGHMQGMYHQAKAAGGNKRVIITETGWPSQGESLKGAHASKEGALRYFIETQLWAGKENIEVLYFSSFDESWKVGAEGEVGAYWGIWDKNEKIKYGRKYV